MSFINASGTFENETSGQTVTVFTPLTGSTLTLRSNIEDVYITGALAALTINLGVPSNGAETEIYFQGAITALLIRDRAGAAIATAPTVATAGQSVNMRYVNKTVGWVRWR